MLELKELQEKLNTTWSEMKGLIDKQAAEIKANGQASGETKAALEKANTDLARIEGETKKRLDDLETKLARPGLGGAEQATWRDKAEHKAWLKLARGGMVSLQPEERKVLFISDETTGGYLAVSEYVGEIIKNVTEYSPIRSLARIRTTGKKSIEIPVRTGSFSAVRTHERATRTETTGLTYGLKEIPVHEMYADVRISLANLEDSEFNLEQEIRIEAAEQFGVRDGRDFAIGSGVGEPEGLLTNASVGYTAGGHASTINTGDVLFALVRDVKADYVANGRLLMNRKTIFHVRTLKDGIGRYLFDPGTPGITPPQIAGVPYTECKDMPDIDTNTFPILYGDIRRAYTIVDRVGMSMQRLDEKYAELGQVGFLFRMRDGGQVVQAEAIRKLKIAETV